MADYKLIVREPGTGEKAMEEVTDFLWLSYLKKRSRPGLLRAGVPDDHRLWNIIDDYYLVEVLRRDVGGGLDWYRDFAGIYQLDEDAEIRARTRRTLYVPGDLSMLHWRRVLWASGTVDRSKFTGVAAETVMKTLVTYNVTSAATVAAGRRGFSGEITSPGAISVAVDQGLGNTVDWSCAWDWLDETLYDLAVIGGGDFNLVRNVDNTGWTFEFYDGQLGDDLSDTVIFSTDFDNIGDAEYRRRASQVVSGVLIGGPGEGSARTVSSVTATGWTQATHKEDFVNASNFDTDAARQDAGRRRIEEKQARETIRFAVEQTQGLRYGRDYGLGNRVGRRVFGDSSAVIVDEVAVGLAQSGDETIELAFEVQR